MLNRGGVTNRRGEEQDPEKKLPPKKGKSKTHKALMKRKNQQKGDLLL